MESRSLNDNWVNVYDWQQQASNRNKWTWIFHVHCIRFNVVIYYTLPLFTEREKSSMSFHVCNGFLFFSPPDFNFTTPFLSCLHLTVQRELKFVIRKKTMLFSSWMKHTIHLTHEYLNDTPYVMKWTVHKGT